jgi:ABC-type nitrate/sulfonate/bicarbonate transport system substrate-binding protein
VTLSREAGWATIREKILHSELDAAQAHAGMAIAIHCGIGTVARACVTGIIINLNGSAITLSNELWDLGVRDADSLKTLIRQNKGTRKFRFAHVLEFSAQHYVLLQWLAAAGIDPIEDVTLVVIPSPLVHENLLEGYLDGYCVGEPWSSILLSSGKAWCPATSNEVVPRHIDKVFLVLQEFANAHPEEHLRMIGALIEACRMCDDPEFRPVLAKLLARKEYFDLPLAVIENGLQDTFETGRGRRAAEGRIVFSGGDSNVPSPESARWIYNQILSGGSAQGCIGFRRDAMRRIFREDLYREAVRHCPAISSSGRFSRTPQPAPSPEQSNKP